MKNNNLSYSVGLDIGTTKIVVIVGRKNEHGKIEVMGVGKSKSLGVRQGVVGNVTQTIQSIKQAINLAEQMAGVPIKKVAVGIAGKHIRSLHHSDYIMRENPEQYITEEDIKILKKQVDKLVMLPGEEIIHVLPQDYKVDAQSDIYEPIGMHGKRLEANFHVVVGQMASIKNILKCVKEAGLEMEALTLEPLASSDAVLGQEEKEAGVAIVDIGGGTTDIAIFKDNIIRHTCVIPYGGEIITEDIKNGCSVIEKYAEKLKVDFGSALPDMVKEDVFVTMKGLHGRKDHEVNLKSLSQIINARMEDILELVNNELKGYGAFEQKKKLIAGIVLTGGGSNLQHLRQLSNYLTGFECRIGYANEYIVNDKNQHLKSPEYATAIGLLMESLKITDKKIEQEKEEGEKELQEKSVNTMEKGSSETVPSSETFTTDETKKEDKQKTKSKSKLSTFGQMLAKRAKDFFNEEE